MKYLNLTLKTPEENLACDEALLENAETGESSEEILRFWEPKEYFVVLGYSNKVESEVNGAAAKRLEIPVLRRASGGGTVLQGPGCLNYSLILKIERTKELGNLIKTNHYILNKHREALQPFVQEKIEIQGISDLAIHNIVTLSETKGLRIVDPSQPSAAQDDNIWRKFSGNAQRRKQKFLLYHGTFLIDFDIPLIEKVLLMPSKKPEYRNNRSHSDFLINMDIPTVKIKQALQKSWNAHENHMLIPPEQIKTLIQKTYSSDS